MAVHAIPLRSNFHCIPIHLQAATAHDAAHMQHKRRYTDPSRPLCRVLRQLGNGNVVDGMYAAKEDNVFDKDIVHALTPSSVAGVDVAAVRRELKSLPPKSRKIDLACMYRTGATGSVSEVRCCTRACTVAQMFAQMFMAFVRAWRSPLRTPVSLAQFLCCTAQHVADIQRILVHLRAASAPCPQPSQPARVAAGPG